jgi:TolB-like protein
MSLFEELKRRNVIRVAVAYVITCWFLVQVADIMLEAFIAPSWVLPVMSSLLALGFGPALIFAWAFEITPEGVKHERDIERDDSIAHVTAKKLDYAIIFMLVFGGGFIFWEGREGNSLSFSPPSELASEPTISPESIAPVPVPMEGKSIAVLPFVNLSSDPEQEFFSDGISEELLNVLAQFPDLRVAARTSSFQFKGTNSDVGDIARQLKVNHILEGSVRKSGTRLRITAQLIEAESGYHLWSQSFDRELEDIFAIQDEISAAIGEAMKVQLALAGSENGNARSANSTNTAAYEAYLKGRALIHKRGNLAMTEARGELEKSVRLDPNFAPAQAQLAIAIIMLSSNTGTYGDLTMSEVHRLAQPHIDRALILDPELAEAYAAMSLLALNSEQMDAAIEYADRAFALNSANVDVLNWKAIALISQDKFREEYTVRKMIVQIDPLSVVGLLGMASSAMLRANFEYAHKLAEELIQISPWAGYSAHGSLAQSQGDISKALYWYLQSYAENPRDRQTVNSVATVLAVVGEVQEALRVSNDEQFAAKFNSGELEGSLQEAQRKLRGDNRSVLWHSLVGSNLVFLDRSAEALPVWEELMTQVKGNIESLLFFARRDLIYTHFQVGQAEKARKRLADIGRLMDALDMEFGTDLGRRQIKAEIALLRGDWDGYVNLMQSAIDSTMVRGVIFGHPMLAPHRDKPEFKQLQERLQAIHDREHREILQLVCTENPIPDSWQPLPETCKSFNLSI